MISGFTAYAFGRCAIRIGSRTRHYLNQTNKMPNISLTHNWLEAHQIGDIFNVNASFRCGCESKQMCAPKTRAGIKPRIITAGGRLDTVGGGIVRMSDEDGRAGAFRLLWCNVAFSWFERGLAENTELENISMQKYCGKVTATRVLTSTQMKNYTHAISLHHTLAFHLSGGSQQRLLLLRKPPNSFILWRLRMRYPHARRIRKPFFVQLMAYK